MNHCNEPKTKENKFNKGSPRDLQKVRLSNQSHALRFCYSRSLVCSKMLIMLTLPIPRAHSLWRDGCSGQCDSTSTWHIGGGYPINIVMRDNISGGGGIQTKE